MATGSIILPILAASPDPTNPPGIDWTAAGRPFLLFDDGTDELCIWTFMVPADYSSAPVVKLLYSMATATTNEVICSVEVMGVADGADLDTDAWDTANASTATTVPGTAGLQDTLSITLTNDGSPSALALNTYAALRLRRDADNAGDDASGDLELWAISFEYTTS